MCCHKTNSSQKENILKTKNNMNVEGLNVLGKKPSHPTTHTHKKNLELNRVSKMLYSIYIILFCKCICLYFAKILKCLLNYGKKVEDLNILGVLDLGNVRFLKS